MVGRTRHMAGVIVFVAILVPLRAVQAQDANTVDAGAGAPPEASPQLVPPELIEAAEAIYPEQARAQRVEATVVLRLTVDVQGNVVETEVLEPAGNGFDEAARDAALRFRFKPALKDGEAVTARIRYAFPFTLPPEIPSTADADAGVANGAQAEPQAASIAAPAPAPAPIQAASTVEVSVRGRPNEGERLQQSAEAVNVIDTRKAQQQTADLGEVLARTQGVAVRREAGLGSNARFSLNGLYDDQIRFFLDGVPLDFAGYPFGIVNVPVNLVDRVEVYRGVVPIRFGADALGGAVNLVSDRDDGTHAGASYQVGSFGTHRVTVDGRYLDVDSGLIGGGSAFFDRAKNDYDVDVEVPDSRGRLSPATVPRFHDGYRAYGGEVEGGVVDRTWARRLTLQLFASTYDKQLQNNIVMTVPYGGVVYGETVYGATARYDVDLGHGVGLQVVANYSHHIVDFTDDSEWVYDWYGHRIRERRVGGEIEGQPTDQTEWQNSGFGRTTLTWAISPQHTVRASLTPTFTARTGEDHLRSNPSSRDPLNAKRDLFTFVSGVEYEVDLLDERLSNIVFVKDYVYDASSEEVLPGNIFAARDRDKHSVGAGDALRFRFTPWLYAKASYEYATRLPRPDEVFGNGVLIRPNLKIEPEVSHNANIGPRVEWKHPGVGELIADVNAFLRDSDRLIVLLGNDRFFSYQNIYHARGLGLENALAWSSPGRYVNVDGQVTWQDVRNASDSGTFADFEGDRIPNRPYLFASWGARLRFASLPGADDALEPFYIGRYVHGFFRGWESQGLREYKQTVDAQVTHDAGVSYTISRDFARVTITAEIDNLTNAKVFDFFGAQRPGRAFYLKVSGEI